MIKVYALFCGVNSSSKIRIMFFQCLVEGSCCFQEDCLSCYILWTSARCSSNLFTTARYFGHCLRVVVSFFFFSSALMVFACFKTSDWYSYRFRKSHLFTQFLSKCFGRLCFLLFKCLGKLTTRSLQSRHWNFRCLDKLLRKHKNLI